MTCPGQPSIVVHVHGSSYGEGGTGAGAVSAGQVPAPAVNHPAKNLPAAFPHDAHAAALGVAGHVPQGRAVASPHDCQKSMPARWSAFIRANFANYRHVMQVFGVSERAARKWWNGEGGVNGAYVVHALRVLPGAAQDMLIAAE